ncbi:uncharacterized protein LOC124116411 [Haliotis rufescens]|uniref:uncharacterized protein LOC124116411 n=1 Tax=Haliotis rufescens TaxID=6454 RepID=UPI00201F0B55|nr:uncharacterized protein LOC124116411 [Haliotis rufescens]
MKPVGYVLVLVILWIKGTMSMPRNDGMMDVTPSSEIKKTQVNREHLIRVLCNLTKRFTSSDVVFKRRLLQRRYSTAPNESDVVNITEEVRLRRLDVLSCCENIIAPTALQNQKTEKYDASPCLEHVRRRRIDRLCSRDNHSVPFNLNGRSFMKKKILDCCSKLGETRYSCFQTDSLKNKDSSAEVFSFDETDTVNDIWDFPITSSQIQQLIGHHASSAERAEARQQKRRGITNGDLDYTSNRNPAPKDATVNGVTSAECACKLQDKVAFDMDRQSTNGHASGAGSITTAGNRKETKSGVNPVVTTTRPSVTVARPAYSLTSILSDSSITSVRSTYSFTSARSTPSRMHTRATSSFTSVRSSFSPMSVRSTSSLTTVRSTTFYTPTKMNQNEITSTNMRPFHPAALISYFKKQFATAVTSTPTTVKFTQPSARAPLYTFPKRQRGPLTRHDTGHPGRGKLVEDVRHNNPSTIFSKYYKMRSRTTTSQQSGVTPTLTTSPKVTFPNSFVNAHGGGGQPVVRKYRPKLTLPLKSHEQPRPATHGRRIKQTSFGRHSGRKWKKPKHKHRECIYSLMNMEDVDAKELI